MFKKNYKRSSIFLITDLIPQIPTLAKALQKSLSTGSTKNLKRMSSKKTTTHPSVYALYDKKSPTNCDYLYDNCCLAAFEILFDFCRAESVDIQRPRSI